MTTSIAVSEVNVPDTTQLEAAAKPVADLVEAIQGMAVTNQVEYEDVGAALRDVKATAKRLDDERKEMTRPLDQAKKRILDFFRAPTDALARVERELKGRMLKYTQEQNRIAREAEAKAREKAERERKKLEEQARKAEEAGREERAELLRERAEEVVTPTIPTEAPKAEGVHTVKRWSAEVTDKMALIKAVAAGTQPDVYLEVNMKALHGVARSLKEHLTIPGVKAVATETMSARS